MKIFILSLILYFVIAKRETCPVQKFSIFPSHDEAYPSVNSCTRGSIEKILFEKLKIHQVDGHHKVFSHWYENLDRSKKYTLVHIDSRIFFFEFTFR